MKYRVTVCPGRHDATVLGTDDSYIYLDSDTELCKVHGIYERKGTIGASLRRDKPVPEWVTKILRIPGVMSVHLSHYGLFLMYAPLFDDQKIVSRTARILKATFSRGERLERLLDYNPPFKLLPEDLEGKLRQIIEDYFYRNRRLGLRKSRNKSKKVRGSDA